MSENLKIELNRAFRHHGSRVVYKGRARDPGRSYLFVDPHGIQHRLTAIELSILRDRGEFPDWKDVPERGTGVRSMAVSTPWEQADEVQRRRAKRAQDYCMAWAATKGAPRSKSGLLPIIASVYERRCAAAEQASEFEPRAPSVNGVQKWLSKWIAQGRIIDALIPQDGLKGNRSTKLKAEMSLLLRDYIDEFYLADTRLSVAELHRRFRNKLRQEDQHKEDRHKRKAPSYRAVLKAVGDLCKFTVDFCRDGEGVAKERWRSIGSGLVTERANQVWEIDDTRVDLLCVGTDGTTVIGQPWLIVVIDRHTRMIMGFYVSFSPPDTTAVMEALKMAMLRKDDLLKASGLTRKWEAHGRPDEIHVDNAKHYNSESLKFALSRLGIALHTMPVMKAWYKGTVERLIGTLTGASGKFAATSLALVRRGLG